MKLTVLVRPFQPAPGLPSATGTRSFYEVDEFAAALARVDDTSVSIREGSLRDAPADGYVILFGEATVNQPLELTSRIVLINADRSSVPECLERDHLAGAVEKHRYFLWQTNPTDDRGYGLFGRKEVTMRIGMTLTTPYQTEHYGLVTSSSYLDLPSLVVGYLKVYDQMRGSGELT